MTDTDASARPEEETARRTPPRVRQPVLSKKPRQWATDLRAEPNEWHIIASGSNNRLGVISQTAYRIRENQMAAFRVDGTKKDGRFEATVSTAANATGRQHPVELWARWIAEAWTPSA